jgi:hypothetical protein
MVDGACAECALDWLPGQGIRGTDGLINAMTTCDPDGPGPQTEALIVGGEFTLAGNTHAKNIAWWDGTAWHPTP